MNSIKLSEVAVFADGRIKTSALTVENYVGTDNILQNKTGKVDSQYLPHTGQATAYQKADILVANIRPYLKKIWFADNDGGSSADVSTIRVNNSDFLPDFVYYNLFQDEFFDYAMKGAKGSKMPRLDKKQIMGFPIANIDPISQAGIVKILGGIDKKINLNSKINNSLESIAQLIYNQWFVQFDFPDANNRPYKTAGGPMVYNETLKQEVPANWSVCELQDLVEIRRGATITKKDVGISGAVKVVAAGLDYSYFHNKSNRKKNTITVSASGANAGYIRLWREPIYASDCITLNGETDSMTFYAWGYLQLVRGHVSQQARGSAQPHVYPSDLATLPIAIPPIKLFEQFKSIVVPVQEEVGLYETQNDNLVKLRDSLLPLLMNGQASLKD